MGVFAGPCIVMWTVSPGLYICLSVDIVSPLGVSAVVNNSIIKGNSLFMPYTRGYLLV